MDKYLSRLKPVVCLNSIRAAYKKPNNEELTRKRILTKYLQRLFDEKLREYMDSGTLLYEDRVVTEDMKRDVIDALTEQVLNGKLDSEDGSTEKILQDILSKFNINEESQMEEA